MLEVQDQGSSSSTPNEKSLLGLQMAMTQCDICDGESSYFISHKVTNPIKLESSHRPHPTLITSKALSSNAITLKAKVSMSELWTDTVQFRKIC